MRGWLAGAALLVAGTAWAETLTQVKDLCPGNVSSSPTLLTASGGKLYFVTGSCGPATKQLWVSDGTAAGTSSLLTFKAVNAIVPFGTGVLINADDGIKGAELWKSDGSVAGTAMVLDIFAGANGSNPSGFQPLGTGMVFVANHGSYGVELWKTDGTAAGTVLVKDIYGGATSSSPSSLVSIGGTVVYFSAHQSILGYELWKSDGTAAGTVLVKEIASSFQSSSPSGFTAFNGFVYFSASQSGTFNLWRTDGTTVGTTLVSSAVINPTQLTVLGTSLLFSGQNGSGIELWKSDAGGTALLKDIYAGSTSSSPGGFISLGGKLLFHATDATSGNEPRITDGTAAGTTLLKDVAAPGSSAPGQMVVLGNVAYFPATTAANGAELWRSDGTIAGTTLVKDLVLGATSSAPANLVAIGQRLYFTATDPVSGNELWAMDIDCANGTHHCGNSCVDDASPSTCGTACAPCAAAPANATATCDGTSCGHICNTGFLDCGDGRCEVSCCTVNADCSTPPSSCFLDKGTCTAGKCAYPYNDGAACDADQDKCTPNDSCLNGACVADTMNAVTCVNVDCKTVACNPMTGDCEYAPLSGVACGGDGCFDVGSCTDGMCDGTVLLTCPILPDACHAEACSADSGMCSTVNAPNGTVCDTTDKCVVSTPACFAGRCTGDKTQCAASSSCHAASCNSATGACDEAEAPDGTPCVPVGCEGAGMCQAGACACDGGMTVPDKSGCDCAIGGRSAPGWWALGLVVVLGALQRRRGIHARSQARRQDRA